MLILITGGAGSGKSVFAENLAIQLNNNLNNLDNSDQSGDLYYFATMQVRKDDPECLECIRKHREQRAGKHFVTIETPFLDARDFTDLQNLSKNSGDAGDSGQSGTGLLECMSNLLANLQFSPDATYHPENPDLPALITEKILQLSGLLRNLVIITNEIFTDTPPEDPAMQDYLQNLGKINCNLAQHAGIVLEIQAGIPVIWKGESLFFEILRNS